MEEERRMLRGRWGIFLNDVLRVTHPEAAAGAPGPVLQRILVLVLVLAMGAIAAFSWEWFTTEARARHEAEIAEEIEADDGADPEIWSYMEFLEPNGPPSIRLLDSLDDETNEKFRNAWNGEAYFARGLDWLWASSDEFRKPLAGDGSGLARQWNITLNSTSSTAFTITDLQLADLHCELARAKAAFELLPQGSDNRSVISFSVDDPTVGKLYGRGDADGDASHSGEPFFDEKVVNLGGREEGVGFTVEVVTTDKDCTWSAFEFSYHGPHGNGTYDVVRENGEPFGVRGTAPDAETFTVYPYGSGTLTIDPAPWDE